MKPINTLPPFKRFCATIGNLPSSYVDSLSYYENLMWLCKYLKDTVVPTVNENAEAVNELINWFNNLDVQDEIDKKLDEMVESGELQAMIGAYVDEYIATTNARIDTIENDNKSHRSSRISLQNYINYDGIGTKFTQGSCVGDDGTIYVYVSDDTYNGGSLLVFNNEKLTSTITGINFKHGNCLTYLNGKIYSATADGKKIVSYELNTGVSLELNPFESVTEYNKITGISKYDENHLLCLLYNTNQYGSSSTPSTTYLLDIRDNSYVEIEITNTENLRIDYYASQGMCYKNNHMYVLTSYPSMVLDYVLENNTFNINKLYSIPMRDQLGLLVGEVEDISPTSNGDCYLLTSHVVDNNERYLATHFVSFESDLAPTYLQYVDTDTEVQNYRQSLYVDNGDSPSYTLYEDGSVYHPFKTLRRGIAAANYGEYYIRKTVQVRSRGIDKPYSLGLLYGIKGISIFNRSNFNTLYINGNTLLVNCDLNVNCDLDDSTVFNGEFKIRNSNVTMFNNRIIFNNLIILEQCSSLKTHFLTLGDTSTTTPISLYSSSTMQAMIQSTATTSPYVYQVFGGSLAISNIETSKVLNGVGGTQGVYIKAGSKIGS